MATLTQKVPLTSFANGATISLPAGITTDARLVLVVAYAAAGLPTGSTSVTIGGNYTSWTSLASNRYRVRRHLEVLLSNGEPTDSWTINCNVVGTTYQQGYYAIYELTSYDGTTPSDTWQEAGGADDAVSSPLAVASVGTIGSGDVVLAVGALEITSAGQSWSTGVTGLESVTDLSDLRNVYLGSTTTDDTPQMEWTGGSSGAYLLAGIFNDGSTAVPASGYDGTGTWQLFPSAGAYLDDGTINVSTHSFKARLLSDSYTTDPTDTVLADTTGALGTDQTVTLSVSGGTVSIASDVVWTGALANVRHILIYDDTPTSPADPLLAIVDLGANQSVPTSTTFTLPAGDVYFR